MPREVRGWLGHGGEFTNIEHLLLGDDCPQLSWLVQSVKNLHHCQMFIMAGTRWEDAEVVTSFLFGSPLQNFDIYSNPYNEAKKKVTSLT